MEARSEPAPGSSTCGLLLQLFHLCLSVGTVATACAECAAACLGFAACSSLARHLLPAGLTLLLGFAPLTAAQVADIFSPGASAAARTQRACARRRLAEADNAIDETTAMHQQQQHRASTASDDLIVSELHPDLMNYISDQNATGDVQLIKNDSGSRSTAYVLRRFVNGIRGFYRPGAAPEIRKRRQLVALLIGLPMSCAYALPLYNQLYATGKPLPPGCLTGSAAPLLRFFARFVVFSRGGAVGAACLVSLVASGISLARRHLGNRMSDRLRLGKSRPFFKLFD